MLGSEELLFPGSRLTVTRITVSSLQHRQVAGTVYCLGNGAVLALGAEAFLLGSRWSEFSREVGILEMGYSPQSPSTVCLCHMYQLQCHKVSININRSSSKTEEIKVAGCQPFSV